MDNNKLKKAFKNVKTDIGKLSEEVTSLKIEIARGELSKTASQTSVSNGFEKKRLDNLVKNVENEFKKLNLNIKELDDKISMNNKKDGQIEFSQSKLKKQIERNISNIEKNYLNVSSVEERFAEFSELINEKISLETASMRLEFTDEIAKIYDKLYAQPETKSAPPKKKKTNKVTKSKKQETPVRVQNENKIENVVLEPETSKKDGKVKRVLKWLFVDEEDDYEVNDIKAEVKKSNSSKSSKKK